MTEENKNMNFFNRFITSIKDFEKYAIFATEKTRKAIAYLALVILIFSIAIASVFTYKFNISTNNAIDYFKSNISEVSYKDNNLNINSGEELKLINPEEVLPIVIINTNTTEEQEQNYQKEINSYENGILILKDKFIYKNEMLSQNINYEYKDIASIYGISEFEKEDVLTFIANTNNINLYVSFFVVIVIYLFTIYFVSTMADVIMLGILGFIFSRIVGIRLRFKATFNMGVYALTLPILLNMIYIIFNSIIGLEIKYFSWMYTTISYIYMIVAILMIKTDLINRQVELMKIIEEQEKVKKEIEEQQRRKEEEEKKEPKDNNEKKEKKKDKKGEEKGKETGLGDSRSCTTRK